MIRLLQTSDWHLGRILNQKSLLDDQRWVLEHRFLPLVRHVKPDLILIAGDVYDRQVPAQDAIDLLDSVLRELVLSLQVPVMMISGNHDSGTRLAFASELLRESGLYIVGKLTAAPLTLALPGQSLTVAAVPYFDPVEMRVLLQDTTITSHDAAMSAWLRLNVEHVAAGHPSLLIAHLFVQGGQTSESERILAAGRAEDVGGSGQVDPRRFDGWDFVALGHLHVPQQPSERMNYSGSLFQYAFSEPADKSVTVVELEPGRAPVMERLALEPVRKLRKMEGSFDALLAASPSEADRNDYLRIEFQCDHPIPFAMERLRERYPNVLEVVRSLPEAQANATPALGIGHVREFGLGQLLETFYRTVVDDNLSSETRTVVDALAAEAETRQDGGVG